MPEFCPFSRFVSAAVILLLVYVVSASLASAQTSTPWRYDLRAGDHLIYSYTFQRQTQSAELQAHTESRFQTHVLVTGENAENISIGFQRNREDAKLTEYQANGKDKLAHEKVEFDKRMQRRLSRFSEAMEISPSGKPRFPWEMAREGYSHILATLHEVMILPAAASKGESWRDATVPGLEFGWVGDESIHGRLCHHAEATKADGSLTISYWWSPESGVIEQETLEGTYSLYESTAHETVRIELDSRTRDEPLENWLASPDTRLGALQSVLLTPTISISAHQLTPVLTSDDSASQTLALAIASRRAIDVPSDVLNELRQKASAEARNQLLQTQLHLLGEHSSQQSRLSQGKRLSQEICSSVDDCRYTIKSKPPAMKFGTMLQLAPLVKDDSNIPYLLRIPLTYREDQPSPLLIYLSGSAGFAIDGMNSAEDAVSQTDYLVLYPQAAAYWWTPEVARRFDSVFHDVVQRYNVDPDRIYITGFSNGGTGALYFAELWPQRFAAAVSLMGAGQCIDQLKAGLPNVKNLPLLFVHGEDDTIIAPECSKSTETALADLQPAIKPELKILPHHAHDITLLTDEGLTLAFFEGKIRHAFPRSVELSEFDALAIRNYWIEILNGKPGKSDLEARVKPDNTIEIHSHDVKSVRLHLRPELLAQEGDVHVTWNGKRLFSGPVREICSTPTPYSAEDPKMDLTDNRDLTLP